MSEPAPALLTLKSRQDCGGGPEEMELFTQGTLRQTPEGWEIAYEEPELTDMAGVRTCFHLTEGRAVLHRGGGIETRMVFEEGRPHAFRYATPYGSLSMEAETERLRWRMGPHGGLLELRYRLTAEGQVTIQSRVTLSVREKR